MFSTFPLYLQVLRSAGYRTHALWVAERAGQPDWLLELLLEEGASYEEALAYLDSLPRRQVGTVASSGIFMLQSCLR